MGITLCAVTPEVREYVTERIEAVLGMRKHGYDPIVLPDDTIALIHRTASIDPKSTVDSAIDEAIHLMTEYCDRYTVREYFALREHFKILDNMMTRIMLLNELHRPACNKQRMDINDQISVQRNTTLLSAMNMLSKYDYHEITGTTATRAFSDSHNVEQWLSSEDLVVLLLDYPQHWDTLIATLRERGYETGLEVFRNMMGINSPSLMQGVL